MDQIIAAFQLLLTLFLGYFLLRKFLTPAERPLRRSVAILVLGDVGRSPRMMYHAESFANNHFDTYIVGNKGAQPIPSLLTLPQVRLLYLPDPPKSFANLPFIISAPRKIILQVFSILETLLIRIPHPPEFILVQNPPSIPTLALVWLVSWIRGSKVIIDWHNLGYSILALKLGKDHLFVKIAEWFEAYFGRSAYAHLFVTQAMHDFLVKEWDLQGLKLVLHDRPPAHFHRASPQEMHELFLRLTPSFQTPDLLTFLPSSTSPTSTPFTRVLYSPSFSSFSTDIGIETDTPVPSQRPDRPALLLSSTSWTPDEDFSILLKALSLYEQKAIEAEGRLPKVLMVVTGKGPEREKYMNEVGTLQSGGGGTEEGWKYVRCVSMWLEAADYPLLLGSADIGISLHSSSSALDLPMKVVDMFGCGLPVCALNFKCLDELVRDGVNGLVFRDAEQLAAQLESLLTNFPSSPTLASLCASLQRSTPIPPTRSLSSISYERSDASTPVSASTESPTGETVFGFGRSEEWEWCSWTQNWDRLMRPLVLPGVKSNGDAHI